MRLNGLVKRLYRPLLPLLTTAVISGCNARAEPVYTPTPSTPPTATQQYTLSPTPLPTVTLTPTPSPEYTPKLTPSPTPTRTVTPTPQLPQSVLNQLSYLPDNVRTALIDELKTDTDWDKDNTINHSDSFVLDPSNTISQPKYQTIVFIKNLKQRNKDGLLLPQVYNQLAKALFTVDNNPQYFQETTPDRAHVTVKLVDSISTIIKYPRGLSLGAVQVESLKLTDDHAMQNFVIPAIGYVVSLQEESKINALNGWGIPDKALEDEGIRQVLLPEELLKVRIKEGKKWVDPKLEIGIENVSYDSSLGKSPQEWLREIGERYFIDKASRVYEEAMWSAMRHHPFVPWPYSGKSYLTVFDAKRSQDELAVYVLGLPGGLFANDIIPSHPTSGQVEPYLAVLVGRAFGRPAFVVTAPYPNSPPDRIGTHDEAYVLTNDGSFFGFWLNREAFLKDYEVKPIKPALDGKFKPFKI